MIISNSKYVVVKVFKHAVIDENKRVVAHCILRSGHCPDTTFQFLPNQSALSTGWLRYSVFVKTEVNDSKVSILKSCSLRQYSDNVQFKS